MSFFHSLWFVAGLVFLMNVPFGFWRAGVRRFSGPWFAAVHVPVVLSIGLRVLLGMRFVLGAIPVFVAAFFLGQSLGGAARSRKSSMP